MISGKRGIFWMIEGRILAVPYEEGATIGLSKTGNNYNHKLLWESVKPERCIKPFDYYPRGRVEFSNKGKPVVFMSPHIGKEYIPIIMERFGITEVPKVHYDGSRHYRCHMDD